MKKAFFTIMLVCFLSVFLASCDFSFNFNNDPLHIHSYTDEVVAATCTEGGYTLKTCSKCGDQVKVFPTNPLGHEEETIPAVAKTCTTSGLTEGTKCKRCGLILKAQEEIPASHNWDYSYSEYGDKEATCTEDGVSHHRVCLDCHHEEGVEEVIPALGHDYENTVETVNGHQHTKHVCSRCHDTYCDSLIVNYIYNHDYQEFISNDLYEDYKNAFTTWYKELYEGCMAVLSSDKDYSLTDNTVVSTSLFKVPENVLSGFTASFMNNNPEFYFLSNLYGMTSRLNEVGIVLKIDSLYYNHEKREQVQNNIKETEKIVSKLCMGKTEVEKAKTLHDYLAQNTYYQFLSDGRTPSTASWAHNIDGIFDQNDQTGSVCEGYSHAYLYLSHLVGVKTMMVVGTYNGTGHAWNYTCIDNKWYGVDVTWDDQGANLYYDFFLASKSEMEIGTTRFENANHIPGVSDLIHYDPSTQVFQTEVPTLPATRGYAL